MLTTEEKVKAIAASLGFNRTVIGALAPLTEELTHYQGWLERGYAAGMEYMKRDPQQRITPERRLAKGRSVVIVSAGYYTEKPPPPGFFYGNVARYAVGLDYHAVIRRKLRELADRLSDELDLPVSSKAYTDDVALYEQALAERHGLGFAGKNSVVIGPRLSGSYNLIGELFLDVELDADGPYAGTCGQCFRCGQGCPTNAIVEPGLVDSNLCISYLTIENKGGIGRQLRSKIGDWVFGCDVCQEVCPYNQRPPVAVWEEFLPEQGVGHYLDLCSMLAVKSQDEFHSRFSHTPLRRPKLRGIQRNSLVVIGNKLAGIASSGKQAGTVADVSTEEVQDMMERLFFFAAEQVDPMLREHAAWALAQAPGRQAGELLERLLEKEGEADIRQEIACHLAGLNS